MFWRLAFVDRLWNFKNKFDMKNKISINHEKRQMTLTALLGAMLTFFNFATAKIAMKISCVDGCKQKHKCQAI